MSYHRLPDGTLVHINQGRTKRGRRPVSAEDLRCLGNIVDAIRKGEAEKAEQEAQFIESITERESTVGEEQKKAATRISKCRSCEAAIRWTKTMAGQAMPVDAEPVPTGGFWLTLKGGEFGTMESRAIGPKEVLADPARKRYVSHFATCPNAKHHRKPKTSEGAAR